jgi:thioredoxin-related protein
MWAETPLITPQGLKTTAAQWANELNLFYTPTLLFFDEQGKEIIRIDSTVQLYRLYRVMKYVLDKVYLKYPLFLRWSNE